jgi:hypothetical protein
MHQDQYISWNLKEIYLPPGYLMERWSYLTSPSVGQFCGGDVYSTDESCSEGRSMYSFNELASAGHEKWPSETYLNSFDADDICFNAGGCLDDGIQTVFDHYSLGSMLPGT